MSTPVQLVLMIVPLAGYLYLLAVWQGGRHPRVVSGAVDAALLALGLSGLVVFGPFGQLVAGWLFGRMGLVQGLILSLAAVPVIGWLAWRSRGRLVLYHVDAEALESALGEALEPEGFRRTLHGYDDQSGARHVRVDHSRRWQTAVVEGFGPEGRALIRTLHAQLRARFAVVTARGTAVALILFSLSALTMLVPLTAQLLAEPRTRAALRVLLRHLHGG
jgi:hypothetical protein